MKVNQINGIHYKSGAAINIAIQHGKIATIGPGTESHSWVAPGLVDLQVNGYRGIDFNAGPLTHSELDRLVNDLYAQGICCFYPTLITQPIPQLISALQALGKSMEAFPSIAGIHLEGPFISPEDGPRGAHPRPYVLPPDIDLFKQLRDAALGNIRLITLSPEYPGACKLIEWCVAQGIIVAIGHTAASPEQIRDAISAGASMSTHLGNGSHLMLPRHANYLWEQLASDSLTASIIADGFHLPDAFMQVALRAKADRIILVSDSTALAGMSPGTYDAAIGDQVVLTAEGRLSLKDEPALLAGSAASLLDCINYLSRTGLCSWQAAVDMASLIPGQLIDNNPNILKGADANLILLEKDAQKNLVVKSTFVKGEWVFEREV